MTLGGKIQKARKNKGLTQKELAREIGCAEITIRQYETGKREPKLEALGKIVKVLGVFDYELVPGMVMVIGTPEECLAAVEKQMAKKPIIKYKQTQDCVTEIEWKCPTCEANYVELAPCGEWCRYCGTKLDWGEEE